MGRSRSRSRGRDKRDKEEKELRRRARPSDDYGSKQDFDRAPDAGSRDIDYRGGRDSGGDYRSKSDRDGVVLKRRSRSRSRSRDKKRKSDVKEKVEDYDPMADTYDPYGDRDREGGYRDPYGDLRGNDRNEKSYDKSYDNDRGYDRGGGDDRGGYEKSYGDDRGGGGEKKKSSNDRGSEKKKPEVKVDEFGRVVDTSRQKSRSPERGRDRKFDPSKLRRSESPDRDMMEEEAEPVKVQNPYEVNADDDPETAAAKMEMEMMATMGIPVGFDTSKGKGEKQTDKSAMTGGVRIKQQRDTRQYMNRRCGFNKPLDGETTKQVQGIGSKSLGYSNVSM